MATKAMAEAAFTTAQEVMLSGWYDGGTADMLETAQCALWREEWDAAVYWSGQVMTFCCWQE